MSRATETLLRPATTATTSGRTRRTPAMAEARPTPVAVELAAAPAAWLADREVRFLAIRWLAFGSRQRGADQPAMHRTFLVITGDVFNRFRFDCGRFHWRGNKRLR
jgi:hypothetical protein